MDEEKQSYFLTLLSCSAVDAVRFDANARQAAASGRGDLADLWSALARFSRRHAFVWMDLFPPASGDQELRSVRECLTNRIQRLSGAQGMGEQSKLDEYVSVLTSFCRLLERAEKQEGERAEGERMRLWQCPQCGCVKERANGSFVCSFCHASSPKREVIDVARR